MKEGEIHSIWIIVDAPLFILKTKIMSKVITPVRIQRSRKVKQVSPNGLPIVYVGRPTKWGNPYKVGEAGNARQCVNAFIHIIAPKMENIKELSGKNLSCWCKIGEPCHADVLLKLANE